VLRAFERDWFVEPTLQTGSLSPHSLMFRYRKNIYVISYARIDDCDEILRVVLRCDKDGGVDGSHTEDLLIAFRDGESTHLDRQRHIRFSKELLRLVKEKLDIS